MKKLVLNIGLLLFALLGAISCNIKEDMSNCPGSMILDYTAYDDVILDDIGADEQIDVFIFDPNGICIDTYTFTYGALQEVGFEFELPIQYSGYNAVVWQGLNSEHYTSNRMVLGESYENFYLRLVYDTIYSSYSNVPDPLWASPLEPIEFCAKITRHRVYMTRIHTQVNVSLQQSMSDGALADLDVDDFNFTITACNNVYHTDYSISAESILLEYTEEEEDALATFSSEEIEETDEAAHLGTLRITPDMECSLKIESKEGRSLTIGGEETLNLVEYMLMTKDSDEISDQLFLDLNKVWDINLVIELKSGMGYAAVSLSINGWVVWFSSSELS